MLMTTMQLPGTEGLETHMSTHTSTANNDMSLAQEFQKYISHP